MFKIKFTIDSDLILNLLKTYLVLNLNQGPVSNTILRSQETAAVLACQKLCEIGALDNYGRQKSNFCSEISHL